MSSRKTFGTKLRFMRRLRSEQGKASPRNSRKTSKEGKVLNILDATMVTNKLNIPSYFLSQLNFRVRTSQFFHIFCLSIKFSILLESNLSQIVYSNRYC
mmetsp:Transcript_39809/g.45387  ORF Transcript_39809/g.45387 Transcript_39809/m.45387 type:complete len:99 (+) Transcript_39809:752-1048(+)